MTPKTGTELRREALKAVEDCVCKNRQNAYGDAEDNFADIAVFSNIVLKNKLAKPLDALDVALFSACIKLARCKESPRHKDNLVDLAGYAACGIGIVLREQEQWPNGIPDDEYKRMHDMVEVAQTANEELKIQP
jgi:hypothetical protein